MKKHRNPETFENAQSLYHYDQEDGWFYRIARDKEGNSIVTDAPAGLSTIAGVRLTVGREYVMAHHLAWRILYGEWPTNKVSHRDGDNLNNRPENLHSPGQTAAELARKKEETKAKTEAQKQFLDSIGVTRGALEELRLDRIRKTLGEKAYLVAALDAGFIHPAIYKREMTKVELAEVEKRRAQRGIVKNCKA